MTSGQVVHGGVTASSGTAVFGDAGLTIVCDSEYDAVGYDRLFCISDGATGVQYDNTPALCQPRDCGVLSILHALVSGSTVFGGGGYTVTCVQKHIVSDSNFQPVFWQECKAPRKGQSDFGKTSASTVRGNDFRKLVFE